MTIMKKTILLLFTTVLIGCNNPVSWQNYDESDEIRQKVKVILIKECNSN